MTIDRAGNTLRNATRLQGLGVSTIVKDGISKADRDDLYAFSLGDRSRLDLQVLKIKPGTAVGSEVFQLQGKKYGVAVATNVRTQVSTSANKGLKPLVLR